MKLKTIPMLVSALVATSLASNAAIVTIEALDLRNGGIFGHDANVGAPGASQNAKITNTFLSLSNADFPIADGSAITDNSVASIAITYSGLNLDGDATANDTVTFTLNAVSSTAVLRFFNQGLDNGFGSLSDLVVSVSGVSGTTTDLGQAIVFDGFTGATAAMGGNGVFTRQVDVNGTTTVLNTTGGGFQFKQNSLDFAPVSTVTFNNSSGTGGSLVARNYDLQFSTVPEPSVALLGGLGLLGLIRRRR